MPLALAASASANVSSTFDAATGTLTVTSDAADGIAVTCVGAQVKINGNDPLASPLACSAVVQLVVNGGPGDNTINLSGVTAMVWNNGDGSDVMDGQDGTDTAEVNGAGAAGDVFTANPNGQRVRVRSHQPRPVQHRRGRARSSWSTPAAVTTGSRAPTAWPA